MEGDSDQVTPLNGFSAGRPMSFNLSIVSPGLGQQSYILNPVTQSVMGYSAPVALQSYITLPGQSENDVLGVSQCVPISMPMVQGIVLSNDECHPPLIVKQMPLADNNNGHTMGYLPKTMVHDAKLNAPMDNMMLDPATQAAILKKPCPLEMSIKAANIDLEDIELVQEPAIIHRTPASLQMQPPVGMHRTTNEQPVVMHTTTAGQSVMMHTTTAGQPVMMHTTTAEQPLMMHTTTAEQPLMMHTTTAEQPLMMHTTTAEQPLMMHTTTAEQPLMMHTTTAEQPLMMHTTTAGQTVVMNSTTAGQQFMMHSATAGHIQDLGMNNGNGVEGRHELRTDGTSLDNDVTGHAHAQEKPLGSGTLGHESLICEVEEANDSDEDVDDSSSMVSSEDNYKPLSSMVLKIRKIHSQSEEDMDSNGKRRRKKPANLDDYKTEWQPGDGEGEEGESPTDAEPDLARKVHKFAKVRHCCDKKECFKKMTVKDQKSVHKYFYELETKSKQDMYLVNCIEQVPQQAAAESTSQNEVNDIQLDIQHESNGNQILSDEIQNAINESLRDCFEIDKEEEQKEVVKEERQPLAEHSPSWNYYVIIDRCKKKVCLQFLVKVLRISKKRIKALQSLILSGSPIGEQDTAHGKLPSDWTVAAAEHLATLSFLECAQCELDRKHKVLCSPTNTRESLYEAFTEFYRSTREKDPLIKYHTYCRYLSRQSRCSFLPQKQDSCAECDQRKEKKLRQEEKRKRIERLDRATTKCKGKRRVNTSSDSDDEPLIKKKHLKMTISLKKVKGGKAKEGKKAGKVKEGKTAVRQGRDVWSLMLLHLDSMPYKTSRGCLAKVKHRYLNPADLTTHSLYDDYRRYFLKETNSELGLGFAMYDKYFQRNCGYTIGEVDEEKCLKCEQEPPPPPPPPSKATKPAKTKVKQKKRGKKS